jgi:hypothetical protein
LACLSRCRQRVSLTFGIHCACRAANGSRLFPASAACFQIFSVPAIGMTSVGRDFQMAGLRFYHPLRDSFASHRDDHQTTFPYLFVIC